MRRITPVLLSLLIFSGCAGLPEVAKVFGPLIGKHVSVNVPPEIPLSDSITLELGDAVDKSVISGIRLMSMLGSETLEQKFGRMLKESTWPLRKAGGAAFRAELEKADLFKSVVHQGGDLGINLGVSRWGLAYNAGRRRLEPVLDIEASLIVPGLGTVWRASRGAKDLGEAALAKMNGLGVAALLSKPQGFSDAMSLAAAELSRQLVDDLRKNPPKR